MLMGHTSEPLRDLGVLKNVSPTWLSSLKSQVKLRQQNLTTAKTVSRLRDREDKPLFLWIKN
jgi:hypothetical protein